MPDGFVTMREWLAPPEHAGITPQIETVLTEPELMIETPLAGAVSDVELEAAIDDAKRFRAALADAVETCASDLLRDIAGDVLARELLLAPCDMRTIVSRAVARHGNDLVRLRVHSQDASSTEGTDVPIIIDDSLRSGDAVLETRYGSINASLGIRLNRVLSRLIV